MDLNKIFQKARDCLSDGRLEESKEICEHLLAYIPDAASVWNVLGVVLLHLDMKTRAHDAISTSVKIDTRNPEFCANLAVIKFSQGLQVEAIITLSGVINDSVYSERAWNMIRDCVIDPKPPAINEDLSIERQAARIADVEYRNRIKMYPNNGDLLLEYNRFRVTKSSLLFHDRPRVLIGAMNDSWFPNFHTIPLLRVADVIYLSSLASDPKCPERIHFSYSRDSMADILEKLPGGFVPDIFFDNQVCGAHRIPRDLALAPFTTVAGLCHVFRSFMTRDIARQFDFVLPVSSQFSAFYRQPNSGTVLDIPFGLNWGSFHHIFDAAGDKDIDISLTLQPNDDPVYNGWRSRLVMEFHRFQKKYGHRFNTVCITHPLSRHEYFDVLRRSRVTLNAVGVNGPYNYRTVEAFNANAMLVQIEDESEFSNASMEPYFKNGVDYVGVDFNHLESTLIHYMENPQKVSEIASNGYTRMRESYSYERLYAMLFELLDRNKSVSPARVDRLTGQFLLGRTYFAAEEPTLRVRSVVALPVVLQRSGPEQGANLIALMGLLQPIYGFDLLRGVIGEVVGSEKLEPFSSSLVDGVTWYAERHNGHIFTLWNYLMVAEQCGEIQIDLATSVQKILENINVFTPVDFDSSILYLHAGSGDFACHSARRTILEMPLLKTHGTRVDLIEATQRFMLWHMDRYIKKHTRVAKSFAERHLEELSAAEG